MNLKSCRKCTCLKVPYLFTARLKSIEFKLGGCLGASAFPGGGSSPIITLSTDDSHLPSTNPNSLDPFARRRGQDVRSPRHALRRRNAPELPVTDALHPASVPEHRRSLNRRRCHQPGLLCKAMEQRGRSQDCALLGSDYEGTNSFHLPSYTRSSVANTAIFSGESYSLELLISLAQQTN